MKRLLSFFLTVYIYSSVSAQIFNKTFGDAEYGISVRILPTTDNGWVVFTKDSLCMTKFDNCGIPQWSKKFNIPNVNAFWTDFIRTLDGSFLY